MTRSPGGATLVAVFAHPDDELRAAGTLMAQRARGDRVVVVWLTRGEMTEAFGPLAPADVARRRVEIAREAAGLLDVEFRYLEFEDTRVEATPAAAREVARLLCDLRPDGLLTWGAGWVRGDRHPDHEATGKIARDAITLARVAKVVEPVAPHREPCPVFTYRGLHSTLPVVAVDVEAHVERIFEVAALFRRELGYGERGWVERRLRAAGRVHGVAWAEEFDAWESAPGLVASLLPADPAWSDRHPSRADSPSL